MRFPHLIKLVCIPVVAFAQLENNGRGARPIALATAFVAIADDPWLVAYNPAGLAQTKLFQASFYFSPEQFGLRELRTVAIAASAPVSSFGFGVLAEQSGFSLFRASSVRIASARMLSEALALGLTVNISHVSIERYGSTNAVSLDLGASFDLLDALRLGYCWKNVTAASLGPSPDNLEHSQTIGVWCRVSGDLQATIDIEKDFRFPFVIKGGLEQRFLNLVALRFGCSDNPDKFCFGLGALYAGWEFSYAVYTHLQLGLTHQLGISFRMEE